MKEYKATIGGIEHTFQLSDEDAKLRGLDPAKDGTAIRTAKSPLERKAAAAPANKAATPDGDKKPADADPKK